jgi:hypothetical protein
MSDAFKFLSEGQSKWKQILQKWKHTIKVA